VQERTRQLHQKTQVVEHQANELEELLHVKEKLFANISHEFRTPLTLILGPLRQALSATKNKAVKEKIKMASRNSKRLLRLVDQLLGLSRLSSEAPVTGSAQPVTPMIETIAKSFQPLAQDKDISLTVIESDDLWVNCSPDALEKIILNLLSNAVKYTPAGGIVTVETKLNSNDMVSLVVSDTGIGIPKAHQELVFERFHRIDDVGEAIPGAGIGLALVKELAEAHGGNVRLESEPGRATTVTVNLPRHQVEPSTADIRLEAPTSEAIRLEVETLSTSLPRSDLDIRDAGNGKDSILIVEDNVDMQTYLTQLLSESYHCSIAGDGESGVDFALEHVPDLVLCDVMLPKKDGYEVSQILKHDLKTSHIPIIMLTARGDQDSRLKGLREKVDDYLTKPFDDEELKLRIDNLLETRKILKNRFNGYFYKDATSGNGLNGKENGFLEKLNNLFDENYSDPEFGLAQMSSKMAMSERQLQRKLKALTDHGPADYLRAFRLKHALALLKQGEQVGLVAYSVGFSSQAYFSSCFKAQFGATPTQIQQKLS
jgi:CheY-like chemotaxis protein/two-component sensor histidine kinase